MGIRGDSSFATVRRIFLESGSPMPAQGQWGCAPVCSPLASRHWPSRLRLEQGRVCLDWLSAALRSRL